MRRTSTCAWRLCPRVSWPWRGEPALELHHDPVHGGEVLQRPGRQRAVELVQRPRGRQRLRALDLHPLELAPQVLLEAADLVARERLRPLLGLILADLAGRLRAQPERAPDPLHVDAEHAGALAAAPERGDRQPREVAHRRVVLLADRAQHLLAQVVEVDPLAARHALRLLLALGRRALAHALAQRLALDGAEEEALEDEVEHAPVLGRLGDRRRERLAERGALGPADLAERREGVVELGGPDGDALGPQLLGEAQDVGGEGHAASLTPTRSATTSRSVRCLTMIDSV